MLSSGRVTGIIVTKGRYFMATLKEVAALAGVSQAAVSRFLNNDPRLSLPDSTRQRILDAVSELGYVKKTRKNRDPNRVGILHWYSLEQELADPYYLSIRSGIEEYCAREQLQIVRLFKADAHIRDVFGTIDGLICLGKFSRQEMTEFTSLCPSVVFVDMSSPDPAFTTISFDFENAMKDVMERIARKGHRRVAFVTGKESLNDATEYPDPRLPLFRSYAEKLGFEFEPYLMTGEFTRESGYEMGLQLALKNPLPTCILCASDPIAIGVSAALASHDLKIPEDVSVVGFDDIEDVRYTNPPLSSVRLDSFTMGQYAGIMMKMMLENPHPLPAAVKLPCSFSDRGSLM